MNVMKIDLLDFSMFYLLSQFILLTNGLLKEKLLILLSQPFHQSKALEALSLIIKFTPNFHFNR